MFNALGEIVGTLADLFFDSMESIAKVTMKKHFLIRLPVFSIMWLLWLILYPIYMVIHTCISFSIDLELFLIYCFCLALFATIILYPHQVDSDDEEEYEWIKENLKRWEYISFFGEVYFMNLTDAMAFKLRWA